jgi:hypothetical protein
VPQSRVSPHPSGTFPQLALSAAQVVDLQAQLEPASPDISHTSGALQLPQFNWLEQPSNVLPHDTPSSLHVFG